MEKFGKQIEPDMSTYSKAQTLAAPMQAEGRAEGCSLSPPGNVGLCVESCVGLGKDGLLNGC